MPMTRLLLSEPTAAHSARASREVDVAGVAPSLLFALAAAAAGVVAQGGYYRSGQFLLGALLALALGCAWVEGRVSMAYLRSPPFIGVATLGVWAIVCAALAGDVGAATGWVSLAAAVITALTLGRSVDPAARELLIGGLLAIGIVVAATGWAGLAFRAEPWALEDPGLWRAASTLTYANATAGLLVPLALVALGWAVETRASGLSAVACLLMIGVGETASRGGLLALVIGGMALAALVGPARFLRTMLAPGLGALVALAGLAPSMPADSPPRPLAAGLALAVGVGIAWLGSHRPGAVLAIAATAAVVALATSSSASNAFDGRINLSSWDRAHQVRAALDVAAARPLTGSGPGQAVIAWTAPDGRLLVARYAHNEYLQTLVELGAVGFCMVVCAATSIARSIRRGRHGPLPRGVWAGVVAGLAALLVHSGLDFLWHVPVIAVAAALLAGSAIPPAHKEGT